MAENREEKADKLQKLADGVYAFINRDGNSNYGVIETEQGLVVIDNDIRSVDRLLKAIGAATTQPIRFLINTHNAFDHASANFIFARIGAPIISSAVCRQGMAETGQKKFDDMAATDEKMRTLVEAEGAGVVLPTVTFGRRLTLRFGSRVLDLMHFGQGHTPGDILVYLPEERILFAGDLIVIGYHPQTRDGSVNGWLRILGEMDILNPAQIVPGHGPVTQGLESVRFLRGYFLRLKSAVREMAARGKTLDEMLKELTLPEYQHLGKIRFWPAAVRTAYRETVE